MKYFPSKKETKFVFVFDYLQGKRSEKVYSFQETMIDYDANLVLNQLMADYYEFSVALQDYDIDECSVIVLMPSEYTKKSEKQKLKYCDDIKLDLYSTLIDYDQEKVTVVSFGKYSLYTLTGIKSVLQQAGKERNIVIDLTKFGVEPKGDIKKSDLVFRYKLFPLYNLNYLRYNKSVISNFYFTFHYIQKKDSDDFKEQEVKIFGEDDYQEALDYLDDLIKRKDEVSHIYFDIETDTVELSQVLGVSIDYDGNDVPVYIDIRYSGLLELKVRELLRTFPIVGHNLKFDIKQLLWNNIIKQGDYTIKDDTYILANLIYNKTLGGLSLKHLARTLIGVVEDWEKSLDEYKTRHKIKNYGDIPVDVLGKYAGLDAYYTKKVYQKLMKFYKPEYDFLNNQYKEITDLIIKWELNGVKIDTVKLKEIEQKLLPLMEQAKENIYSLEEAKKYERDYGKKLNLNSSKQLNIFVTKYINLSEAKKKTKEGAIKLGKDELEELEEIYGNMYKAVPENKSLKTKYDFVHNLRQYKMYEKFVKSYVNPFKERKDNYDILRVDYNIGGAKSGRLSSFYHTIPSKGDLGKNFKMLIKPRNENYIIVSFDVKALEPRLTASLSKDKKLIQAYQDGMDLYKYVASTVFNKSYDDVTKEERNTMKVLVLAILYGMTEVSFAKSLNISKEEAKNIFNKFYSEFSDVDAWRKLQYITVKKERVVKTPLGREIPLTNETDEEIKRKSVNYLIQSTASELALISFKEIDKKLKQLGLKSFTIGSVHDSLVLEVYIPELFDVLSFVKTYMEETVYKLYDFLKVKLEIDLFIGTSWGNSLEILDFDKKTLVLKGINFDFVELNTKLSKYYNFDYAILDIQKYDCSDISLYSKYDKNRLKEIEMELKVV